MEKDTTPHSISKRLLLISISFKLSVIYICVIPFFIFRDDDAIKPLRDLIPPDKQIIALVLTACAVLTIPLVLYAPRIFVPKKQKPEDLFGPRTTYNSLNQQAKPPLFLDYQLMNSQMKTVTILRLALCQSITLFGFVLTILCKQPWIILPYVFVSLCLMLAVGPMGSRVLGR